jgi:hypothetical protein
MSFTPSLQRSQPYSDLHPAFQHCGALPGRRAATREVAFHAAGRLALLSASAADRHGRDLGADRAPVPAPTRDGNAADGPAFRS